MVMMFVGRGVVLVLDGIPVQFLYKTYGEGVFRPDPNRGYPVKGWRPLGSKAMVFCIR